MQVILSPSAIKPYSAEMAWEFGGTYILQALYYSILGTVL